MIFAMFSSSPNSTGADGRRYRDDQNDILKDSFAQKEYIFPRARR